MKRFILSLLTGLLLYSCGSQNPEQSNQDLNETEILQIVSEPMGYENQHVKFEGIIGHVCRHSGDKMRVFQKDDNDYSVMVMLGDFSGSISQEFEGKEVTATGVVKTEVLNMDALSDHEAGNGGEQEDGHNCASTEEAIARLKERGIDADIAVYVEMTDFEIK